MLNLLRKDFIALKSSLWMTLFYLAVFSAALIPRSEFSLYFVGIYTAFASVSLVTMIDIKNNNHHFLVTLPVSRKHIVQAKYITAILFMLFGVLGSLGIHWFVKLAFPQLNKPDYTALDILVPMGILLVLTSIYMPLFYALSKKGAGIINAVFLIALIILAQPTAFMMTLLNENHMMSNNVLFMAATGILLLFIASYYVAVTLFSRKDM